MIKVGFTKEFILNYLLEQEKKKADAKKAEDANKSMVADETEKERIVNKIKAEFETGRKLLADPGDNNQVLELFISLLRTEIGNKEEEEEEEGQKELNKVLTEAKVQFASILYS